MKRLEVVLCGNSIFFCGLSAGLQQDMKLRIRIVDVPLEKGIQELKMLYPDVIIFELEDYSAEIISLLFQIYPQILLIGVHPAMDLIEIFTNEERWVSPLKDLKSVIKDVLDKAPIICR